MGENVKGSESDVKCSEDSVRAERTRWWLRTRVVNRLAQLFTLANGPTKPENMMRAATYGRCDVCGETYLRHAVDPFEPHLHIVCDGRRLHL